MMKDVGIKGCGLVGACVAIDLALRTYDDAEEAEEYRWARLAIWFAFYASLAKVQHLVAPSTKRFERIGWIGIVCGSFRFASFLTTYAATKEENSGLQEEGYSLSQRDTTFFSTKQVMCEICLVSVFLWTTCTYDVLRGELSLPSVHKRRFGLASATSASSHAHVGNGPANLFDLWSGTFLFVLLAIFSERWFEHFRSAISMSYDSPTKNLMDSSDDAVANTCRLAAYATLVTIVGILTARPPVSRPGLARRGASRIRREASWENRQSRFDDAFDWTFVCADASHEKTHAVDAISREKGETTEERRAFEARARLTGEAAGRQTWWYERRTTTSSSSDSSVPAFNPSKNPNASDAIFRMQQIRKWDARRRRRVREEESEEPREELDSEEKAEDASSKGESAQRLRHLAERAAARGLRYFQKLQCEDGHWAGDYGGPHFLLPGLVIVWYVTGRSEKVLSAPQRAAMRHYLRVHQQTDGGWGTHVESPSTMFGSVLCYVALRLLGEASDAPACERGRAFVRKHGGALYTSSWAKFGLCLLGVMDWRGHNPVPPELWLLPDWFPFHPGRMWCHARMVYLPMSVLYGRRFVYPETATDPLTRSLRRELYTQDYDTISWERTRHLIAPFDNYSPIGLFMRTLQDLLMYWERWGGGVRRRLREAGIAFAMSYIRAEDEQTNFVDIGPVNKVYNMLCVWSEDAGRDAEDLAFLKHALRVRDYLWVAEDGMKMQGYNGSQCWDTSFAIQAVVESGLAERFPAVVRSAWRYLERTQILSTKTSQATEAYAFESPSRRRQFYRHVSKGGWPFSTSAHGWPISDCTAEGLKAILAMRNLPCIRGGGDDLPKIERKRLADAANVLLTLQNEDGGWATYENNRGYGWYELLNPSEVFGDIMIDYSYVECSMASITGLTHYLKQFPDDPRKEEICRAVTRGRAFIKSIQRSDGSFYGSWACCFTYGMWFGLEGLVDAGESKSSSAVRAGCEFLLRHQHPNGGWGEDFTSCFNKSYAANGMRRYGDAEGSGVVQTSWALLGLMIADDRTNSNVRNAVERGVRYLLARQLPSGDFPREGILGVFNRTCGITYTNYRNIFPMWALGRYRTEYATTEDCGVSEK